MADQKGTDALDLAPLPTELNFDDDLTEVEASDAVPAGTALDVELVQPRRAGREDEVEGQSAGRKEKGKPEVPPTNCTEASGDGYPAPTVGRGTGERRAAAMSGEAVDPAAGFESEASATKVPQNTINRSPGQAGEVMMIPPADAAGAAVNKTSETAQGETGAWPAQSTGTSKESSASDTREAQDAIPIAIGSGTTALTKEALASVPNDSEQIRDGEKASPRTKGGLQNGTAKDADAASAFSSPLSSLPDLPTSLPASPDTAPARPSLHPPQLFLSPETSLRQLGHGPSDHAESSAQGAARARKQAVGSGSGSGASKRKAPATAGGGSKKKSSKTVNESGSNNPQGRKGRKGNGTGNGYSQEDAIDIDMEDDGVCVPDDENDDGEYKPGSKAKVKKPIIRRGAKRKVLEYFGRTPRIVKDDEEDDNDFEPRSIGNSFAMTTHYNTSSPYESPEPIERPSRAVSPPIESQRDGAGAPLDSSTGDTDVKTDASTAASTAENTRMTTRGGAALPLITLPERKLGAKPKTYNENQIRAMLRGKFTERQMGMCQRPRYAKWGKCTQCVAKVGGDSCRFKDFRVFPIDPMTADIVGPGFFESYKLSEEMTPLPTEFNVPFDEERILRTEKTVAPILLPLITRELRHIVKNKAIKREVDAAKHRSVCDFCQSTIFAGYFFCRLCGKDYCLSCERFFSDDAETMDQSPWHIFVAARPRLMHCSARAGKSGDGKTLEPGPRSYGNVNVARADGGAVNGASANGEGIDAGGRRKTTSNLAIGEKRSEDGFLTSPSIPLPSAAVDTHSRGVKRKADGSSSENKNNTRTDQADDLALAAPSNRSESTMATGVGASTARNPPRTRQIKWHFRPDLQPVSRFDEEEIKRHWLDLAGYSIKGEETDWKALFGLGELEGAEELKRVPSPGESGTGDSGGKEGGGGAKVAEQLKDAATQVQGERVDDMEIDQGQGGSPESTASTVKQLIDGITSLRRHIDELAARTGYGRPDPSSRSTGSATLVEASDPLTTAKASTDPSDTAIASLYTRYTHPTAPLPPDPASLHADSHPFMRIHVDKLDNPTFDSLWGRGEPMVVDGIDHRLKEKWDPDGMMEMFGDEKCGVTNCETDVAWESTVREFFEGFKDKEGRGKAILKLKDWPATEDFKQTHPRLYNDFSDALPVPDYTRREGAMNLYAHFPPGSSRPDIGPKMYNAFAAREGKGGQGSTRLHMDVADAINVMLYASPLEILPERGRKVEVKKEVVDLTSDAEEGGSHPSRKEGEAQVVEGKGEEGVPKTPKADGLHGSAEGDVSANQGASTDEAMAADAAEADAELHPGPDSASHPTPASEVAKAPDSRDGIAKDKAEPLDRPCEKEITPLRSITDVGDLAERSTQPIKEPQQPGCAVWDIFRAQDADKIRMYLSRKFGSRHVFVDPIHAQMFFLDASMRRELWEKYGVVSHRIYQYPGQAVFIPAGCAHQVCNLADCIKIALDFVSPQNVQRCQQLTQDFRNENFVKAWKEDVLQLYNILWFAWISARETRARREKEKADRNTQDAQHLADVAHAQRKARNSSQVVTSSARDEPAPGDEGTSAPRTPSIAAGKDAEDEAEVKDSAEKRNDTGQVDREASQVQGEQDRLVARLLAAALAAPDAPPPPEARAPSAATGSRWAEAKAAASATAAPIIQRNVLASKAKSTTNGLSSSAKAVSTSTRGPGSRERLAARNALAAAQAAAASDGLGERLSDMIKDGNLSLTAAFDTLRSDMGEGSGLPDVGLPRMTSGTEISALNDTIPGSLTGDDAPSRSQDHVDIPPLPNFDDVDQAASLKSVNNASASVETPPAQGSEPSVQQPPGPGAQISNGVGSAQSMRAGIDNLTAAAVQVGGGQSERVDYGGDRGNEDVDMAE